MVKRVKTEYLNLVEKKIHTPSKPLEIHLFDVALNYYNFSGSANHKKKELHSTVDLICMTLIDEGLFRVQRTQDPLLFAKLWFLEKYFYCMEHLKEIHEEHSGKKSVDLNTIVFTNTERITDQEIESWGNLYD